MFSEEMHRKKTGGNEKLILMKMMDNKLKLFIIKFY